SGHAYASRNGQYQALTTWSIKDNQLHGELTMPISVGTVGGAISVLPAAQNALAILGQVNADELRMVIVSVGLAQNLAALKAIVSGGIQQGHMRMQYRALAMQVGAEVSEVKRLVPRLMAEKHVYTELATKILMEIRNESKS
ncbi:MAG: hydroxymethylglutaryl-CoA reductase, partial [Leuconostoc falkenbergense]